MWGYCFIFQGVSMGRVSVTPFGAVLGADVSYDEGEVPNVLFGHGISIPLDLLVLERFDRGFREYLEEHGKAPDIMHKDGNLQNCTRANLTWHAPLVKSKYF